MTKETATGVQETKASSVEEENTNNKNDEHQQRKITEFLIQKIRKECETSKDSDEAIEGIEIVGNGNDNIEQETISTQEIIEDARERRTLRLNGKPELVQCDQCNFTSGSKTIVDKHIKTYHK